MSLSISEELRRLYLGYVSLQNQMYGEEFLGKMVTYVERGKITINDVIEIFDTLADIDNIGESTSKKIKAFLYYSIEKNAYSSSILDTLYKWQYVIH